MDMNFFRWLFPKTAATTTKATIIKIRKINEHASSSEEITKFYPNPKDWGRSYHYLLKENGTEKYWKGVQNEYDFVYVTSEETEETTLERFFKNYIYKKYNENQEIDFPLTNEDRIKFDNIPWQRCDMEDF